MVTSTWFLGLFFTGIASADPSSNSDTHFFGDAQIVTVPMESTDALPPGYAAYAIPPFSVEFTTINTLSGDASSDAALLQSELAQPLKNIIGSFVQESFQAESANLSLQSMQDSSIPQMLLDYVNVDFDIRIHYRFQEDIDRRLRRTLVNGDASMFYLDFYAVFTGEAYFLDNDNKLPDDQVEEVLGDWLNNNLIYVDEIEEAFTKSTIPLLNNMQKLKFNTNINNESNGSPGGDSTTNGSDNSDDGNYGAENGPKMEKDKKWGHAVKTAFTIVICLVLLLIAVLFARSKWPSLFSDHSIDPTIHNPGVIITSSPLGIAFPSSSIRKGHCEDAIMSPKHLSGHETVGNNDPLPGRGGDADEVQYMRQQSDRWLQKHRPDLFEAVQRAQISNSSSPNKDTPFDEPDHGSSSPRSTPLQFLFGGLFRKNAPSSENSAREDTSRAQNEESLEHDDFSVFEDEENPANYDSGHHWWNNLMAALQTKKLACDEDPTQYEFPFQDFPRHDGTPCLIYSEDVEGSRILRGEPPRRRVSTKESLSDEEFKRVLSLNSEDGGICIDTSQEDLSDGEDDITYATPEFTDKLERLIAMRHRHYERQSILHKHKKAKEEQREIRLQEEARQKARMQQVQEEARQIKLEDEARERELKLRRHEMELDIDTIEAEFSPRASAARRANSGSKESITTAQAVISPIKRENERVKRRTHKKASASDPDLYKTIINSGSSKAIFDLEPTEENELSNTPERVKLSSSANNLSFTGESSPSRFEGSIPRPDLVTRGDSSNFRRKSSEIITPQKPPAHASPSPSPTSRAGGRNRQRSHRRCASYGTGTLDTPSPTTDGMHRRDHSNDDVLTFGIAAYTGAFGPNQYDELPPVPVNNELPPVQVYILMGQSNMVGMGKVHGKEKEGTLEHAVFQEKLYPYLIDADGNWATSPNVRNVRVMGSGTGQMKVYNNEFLSVVGDHIGIEVAVGHELQKSCDGQPIMLLKSCIGNRSLGWDLLPPGSERFDFGDKTYAAYGESPAFWPKDEAKPDAPDGSWYAGIQYDGDVANAKSVLQDIGKYYPGATRYEIAGFFWWQGDKDRYDTAYASHYEQNLVSLIHQLRKDFNAPKAKFVLASLGQTDLMNSSGNDYLILQSMLAVDGKFGKYPEFHSNVETVYTHPLSQGGASNGHYNGNARTYMDVGEAMGRAMVSLQSNRTQESGVYRA